MKEYPILFSTPMVTALLQGRKTQTRRTIKIPDLMDRPDRFKYKGNSNEFDIPRKAIPYDNRLYHSWELVNSNACSWVEHSHKPGDILWVRETYYAYGMWLKNGFSKENKQKWEFFDTTLTGYKYHFEDNPPMGILPGNTREKYGWFKRPSIFMPKVASRIKLLVNDIRVERLQDITAEDAKAEGIDRWIEERMRSKPEHYAVYYHEPGDDSLYSSCPILSYETLWKKINGPFSWHSNPWVWVIEFEKITNNQ